MSRLTTEGPPVAVLRCKLILLGSPASGKSSLLSLLKSRGSMVVKNYKLTSTVEVEVCQIKLPDHPVIVELHIFDTPGQMDFIDSVPKQLQGSRMNALAIVVDVTDASSAGQVERLLELGRSQMQGRSMIGVLIGNKTDLEKQRKIEEGQLRNYATTQGLEYFETNAAQGGAAGSYKDPFMRIARSFYDAYEKKRSQLIAQFA